LEAQLQSQQRTFDEARARLVETFKAASSEALGANNARFLELAQERLAKVLAGTQGDLEKRQQAIEAMVKPIREALEKQSKAVAELEQRREGAYRELQAMVKSAVE